MTARAKRIPASQPSSSNHPKSFHRGKLPRSILPLPRAWLRPADMARTARSTNSTSCLERVPDRVAGREFHQAFREMRLCTAPNHAWRSD